MSKNVFTPDGGPHRVSRVLDVSDGLKRMGEFEAAEMLAGYAALLREREAVKAAVTDEIAERVLNQYVKNCLPHLDEAPVSLRIEAMRRALEAVAPMLASARVPDETGWLIESAFNGFSPSWWAGIPEGCGQSFTDNPNKAVRFCRKDDAEAVAKYMHMVIVTEHKWIAAAPKPEKE